MARLVTIRANRYRQNAIVHIWNPIPHYFHFLFFFHVFFHFFSFKQDSELMTHTQKTARKTAIVYQWLQFPPSQFGINFESVTVETQGSGSSFACYLYLASQRVRGKQGQKRQSTSDATLSRKPEPKRWPRPS